MLMLIANKNHAIIHDYLRRASKQGASSRRSRASGGTSGSGSSRICS